MNLSVAAGFQPWNNFPSSLPRKILLGQGVQAGRGEWESELQELNAQVQKYELALVQPLQGEVENLKERLYGGAEVENELPMAGKRHY